MSNLGLQLGVDKFNTKYTVGEGKIALPIIDSFHSVVNKIEVEHFEVHLTAIGAG